MVATKTPPAPLLLPRRTAHPFGTPPHPASPPTLGPGKPSSVAPWPGCKPFRTRLDYAVDNRTAPPDNRRSPQSRVSPARDCFLLHADPPISPGDPTVGRHRRPAQQLQTATAPFYWNQARTVAFPCPSPLVPTPWPHRIGGFGLKLSGVFLGLCPFKPSSGLAASTWKNPSCSSLGQVQRRFYSSTGELRFAPH